MVIDRSGVVVGASDASSFWRVRLDGLLRLLIWLFRRGACCLSDLGCQSNEKHRRCAREERTYATGRDSWGRERWWWFRGETRRQNGHGDRWLHGLWQGTTQSLRERAWRSILRSLFWARGRTDQNATENTHGQHATTPCRKERSTCSCVNVMDSLGTQRFRVRSAGSMGATEGLHGEEFPERECFWVFAT